VRATNAIGIILAVAMAMVSGLATAAKAELAPAAPLVVPTGPIVLTVSGQIEQTNGDGVAQFDIAALEALGVTSFETTTIWTSGSQTFEGVALGDLLAVVGAKGTRVLATALNDYAVEIPLEEASLDAALLAFRMNGVELSVRDKGPIWVVYPYDAGNEFQTEVIYSRSIWQLDRIEVLP
jgi:hypothetical protein